VRCPYADSSTAESGAWLRSVAFTDQFLPAVLPLLVPSLATCRHRCKPPYTAARALGAGATSLGTLWERNIHEGKPMDVRVAFYARVSSDQQADSGTIASQIRALR